MKRNIKHTKFELWSTKSKLSDRMMALCSHCHLGPGVKPSAMSPTLQLSTFIKRLQTPLHAHWQDWGKPTEVGQCPMIPYKTCCYMEFLVSHSSFVLFWHLCTTLAVQFMPPYKNTSAKVYTLVHNLANGSVRRSRLYLLLLWSSICQGFSCSINIYIYIKKVLIALFHS